MSSTNSILPSNLQDVGLNPAVGSDKSKSDKTDFLNLFVAQLRNQNPLDPQKGDEFLSQLAQFSTVEGIKNLEGSFSSLAESLQSNQALQASNMVGRKVDVPSEQFVHLPGDVLHGSIEIPGSVANLAVDILDSNGNVVKTLQLGSADKGSFGLTWNGLDDQGDSVPADIYRLQAKGSVQGSEMRFQTFVQANVDSVTVEKGNKGFTLNVAGFGPVSMDEIRSIS